jgi:ubiquinone/menaquinone biosynthesis C-methylase UbiE
VDTGPHTSLFTQVDRSEDPDFFVRFMDEAQKLAAIQASKRLMLEGIALAPGEEVLDVGCAPGTDLFEMVEVVGPEGSVVGLDASEVMIVEARRRAAELDLAVTFEVGEVAALSEMVRVTRPGGRILVFDFDWDTLTSTTRTSRRHEPSSGATPTRSATDGSAGNSRGSSKSGTSTCARSIRCRFFPL